MRRLYFTQIIDSRFIEDYIEDKLSYMWNELNNRGNSIKWKLADLDKVSCQTSEIYKVDFGDSVQLRQDYIVSKASRKTTWNDIYDTINSIEAVKYTLKGDFKK